MTNKKKRIQNKEFIQREEGTHDGATVDGGIIKRARAAGINPSPILEDIVNTVRNVNGSNPDDLCHDCLYKFGDDSSTKPPILSSAEIDELLSKTLIANLATLDNDGGIHILPMWFLRIGNDIYIPTSHHTHKYRNLKARPRASVMIDISQAGLNLRGVLIRGRVDLLYGEEARQTNRLIHLKYVTPKGLNDVKVASYLSKGDDITIKIHMDHLISWNLADSKAGKALSTGGWFHPLDE